LSCRIEEYALIGDCETAALVSRQGSVDWLCWPRFDAPACFAALLGTPESGRWSIHPLSPDAHVSRRYRDGTLVLETTFEVAGGRAKLVDFMPPRDGTSDLVRIVIGDQGKVEFSTDLVIRFEYGRTLPWVTRLDEETIAAIAGPDQLVLRTPVPLRGEDMHCRGGFTVSEGDVVPFTLTCIPSTARPAPAPDVAKALSQTERFWRSFSDRCPEVGPWTRQVKRSLITLKALTYAPTGGIVAAPTTSLPEWIGSERNWDYRYCWVRDATFTLLALMHLGYFEEAEAWRDWLLRAVAGSPDQLQIMYGLSGERWLPELDVHWLPGYENSKPVRVGNGASNQLQLDVYGEIVDAMTQAVKGGLRRNPRTSAIGRVMMNHLARIWREPDEGIWEVRGGRRHFVHSKVMAWVAFDRAARTISQQDSEQAARWRTLANEIHQDVCDYGFDRELGSFVQAYGSKQLDASLLLLPLVGFLPPEDSRVRGTLDAIEARLVREGFVVRYDTAESADGLPPGEGAFLACSFWLADNYALVGRLEQAERVFNQLLGLCNDVGLLAEEFDPRSGRMLGNFPQAFSHVGLINTALNLAKFHGPARARAEPPSSMDLKSSK